MPLHGTVYKQSIFGFFAGKNPDLFDLALPLVAIPINKPAKNSWRRIEMGLPGEASSFVTIFTTASFGLLSVIQAG